MNMRRGHFYVVAVSFRSNNPVHRYIVECEREDIQMMTFLTTEEQLRRIPEQLYHFEVISEIKDMNTNRPWEEES